MIDFQSRFNHMFLHNIFNLLRVHYVLACATVYVFVTLWLLCNLSSLFFVPYSYFFRRGRHEYRFKSLFGMMCGLVTYFLPSDARDWFKVVFGLLLLCLLLPLTPVLYYGGRIIGRIRLLKR